MEHTPTPPHPKTGIKPISGIVFSEATPGTSPQHAILQGQSNY
ncbi:MAG: hypothetical protein NXH86_07580 [Flavobacteriaceae bacterium]|nr:hypothetical protein [Flavobacteriaceae bacterium]